MAENAIEFLLRLKNQASPVLEDVAEKAEDVEDATKRAAQGLDDFGDRAGRVGESAGKMAGALSLVPGPAGEAARTIADLADVGEVAATVGKSLGVSLASLAFVAGSVAVAVGALALAYKYFSIELEEAEERVRTQEQILSETKTLTDAVADAKRRLAEAVGGETAEEARNAAIHEHWQGVLEAGTETLRKEKRALEEALAAEKEWVSKGRVSHQAEVERLTQAIANKQTAIYAEVAAARRGEQADRDAAEAARLKADADAHAADNARERAKAEAELKKRREDTAKLLANVADVAAQGLSAEAKAAYDAEKQIKALETEAARLGVSYSEIQPAIDQINDALADTRHALALQEAYADAALWAEAEFAPALDKSAASARAFAASMKGLVPEETLTDMERLSLAAADLALQLSRGEIDQATYDARMGEVEGASESSNLGGIASSAAGVMGIVQGGVGGATSALSAAGPIGMIVAAVIGLVQAIGDGLLENMHAEVMGLFETIGDLGGTLGNFIVSTLREGIPAIFDAIPDLLSGLIDAIPEIIEASIEMAVKSVGEIIALLAGELPKIAVQLTMMLFDPNFWKGIVTAFVDAVIDAFNQAWQAIGDGVSALFDPATWSAMVEFFVRLLGSLWDGVAGAFTTLFSADTWRNIGQWIADAIVAIFAPKDQATVFEGAWWEQAGSDIGAWFDQAGNDISGWFSGGFATGGYVDRTGLALVHQGERVIPPTGTGTQTASVGRGATTSSGITINITGGIIGPETANAIVRELNRHLGTGNRGLAWAG